MRHEHWSFVNTLPTLSRFLGRIETDLSDGRSALVLLPPRIPPSYILDEIKERFRTRQFISLVLDASQTRELAQAVAAEKNRARALSRIAQASDGVDLLELTDFSSLPGAIRDALFDALVSWAEKRDSAGDDEARRAFLIAEPARDLGETVGRASLSAQVGIHWWWGLLSSLEIQLATRIVLDGASGGTEWLESAVAGVCPGDLAAACALWEALPQNSDEVSQVLRSLNPSCEGEPTRIDSWKNVGLLAGLSQPPSKRIAEWASGQIVISQEYGIETSSVEIAARGESEELQRRLWRGQAPRLLPLADDVRLGASRFLASRYGVSWPRRFGIALSASDSQRLDENPQDAELGALKTAFERLTRQADENLWYNRVCQARLARNYLAHYTALDKGPFDGFIAVARSCN